MKQSNTNTPLTHAQEQLVKLVSELMKQRSIIMYHQLRAKAIQLNITLEVEQAFLGILPEIIDPSISVLDKDPAIDLIFDTFAFALVLAAEHPTLAVRLGEYISGTSKFEVAQFSANLFQDIVDEIDSQANTDVEQADVS